MKLSKLPFLSLVPFVVASCASLGSPDSTRDLVYVAEASGGA